MNLAMVASLVGLVCLGLGAFMLAPMAVSLIYKEAAWKAFLDGAFISFLTGGALFWLFREKSGKELHHKEGLAIVGLSWLASGLIGAIPFLPLRRLQKLHRRVFRDGQRFHHHRSQHPHQRGGGGQGGSLLEGADPLAGGHGLYRAVIGHPALGGGGRHAALQGRGPQPHPGQLQPRITDTASVLWKVYAIMTLAETVLLMLGGLDWFDAICQSFATLATGGFSTKNASIAGFNSAYVDWVVTVFMILAGINFSLHFWLFRRKWTVWWRDEECRFYLFMTLAATLIIAVVMYFQANESVHDSLRLAAFQTATILTTTGFATTDYTLWPPMAVSVLLILMFVGGSAGSTGGGPKIMRIMVILKRSFVDLKKVSHPRLVAPVKLNGRAVSRDIVGAIWAFMGLYLAIWLGVSLALAVMGLDVVHAFTASIACLGNIGPGMGQVGPAGNYAALPDTAKWLLSVTMIVGRLELYTILALFIPEFWRK